MMKLTKAFRILTIVVFLGVPRFVAGQDNAARNNEPTVVGRWNVIVHGAAGDYPAWFEIYSSGIRTLVGSFVGRIGSARPIGKVDFNNGRLRFSIPPQWERRTDDQVFEGIFEGDILKGETTDNKGGRITWEAHRAPSLKRDNLSKWEKSIKLFNGKNLDGWKPRDAQAKHGWIVHEGILVNADSSIDLLTERTFTDFKLTVEFRYPEGSNSGIFLRGRYEVQIEDNYGQEPDRYKIGAVYGFISPSLNSSGKANEWQRFEIELVGRVVTIHLNGERVIDRQTIPGITGGALDSDEGKPGPIMLQGDHGRVEFRKLTIAPRE